MGKSLRVDQLKRLRQPRKGLSRAGRKRASLSRLSSRKRRNCPASAGTEGGDGLLHPGDVGCGQQVAAAAEDQVILRIQADHGDFVVQIPATGSEDFTQDARIEKEGGAAVETKAVAGQCGSAAADIGLAFEDGDGAAGPGQQHGCRQTTGPAPTITTRRDMVQDTPARE